MVDEVNQEKATTESSSVSTRSPSDCTADKFTSTSELDRDIELVQTEEFGVEAFPELAHKKSQKMTHTENSSTSTKKSSKRSSTKGTSTSELTDLIVETRQTQTRNKSVSAIVETVSKSCLPFHR